MKILQDSCEIFHGLDFTTIIHLPINSAWQKQLFIYTQKCNKKKNTFITESQFIKQRCCYKQWNNANQRFWRMARKMSVPFFLLAWPHIFSKFVYATIVPLSWNLPLHKGEFYSGLYGYLLIYLRDILTPRTCSNKNASSKQRLLPFRSCR